MYINRALIYGNLTRDPELKALPSGSSVVNFSVATNRTYKTKDGEKKEDVEYHNLVAFGKTAELIQQYMKKGSAIFIEGRIQTRSWEKDEQKHYRTEIVVEQMQFGPRSQRSAEQSSSIDEGSQETAPASDEINSEELPF